MPIFRFPWAVDAESIALPRFDLRKIAMPAVAGHFRQLNAGLVILQVEKAQLDTFGDFGEQGEVGP